MLSHDLWLHHLAAASPRHRGASRHDLPNSPCAAVYGLWGHRLRTRDRGELARQTLKTNCKPLQKKELRLPHRHWFHTCGRVRPGVGPGAVRVPHARLVRRRAALQAQMRARKGDIQLFHRPRARVMGLTRAEKQNVPFSSHRGRRRTASKNASPRGSTGTSALWAMPAGGRSSC